MNELHTKIGKLLKLERERRQLPLEDISGELKISEENLQSIEDGRADELPALFLAAGPHVRVRFGQADPDRHMVGNIVFELREEGPLCR